MQINYLKSVAEYENCIWKQNGKGDKKDEHQVRNKTKFFQKIHFNKINFTSNFNLTRKLFYLNLSLEAAEIQQKNEQQNL